MSTNLGLDHRACLVLRLVARFLDLPNSQRKGDVTAALKEYADEWSRMNFTWRKPEHIEDEDGVERKIDENWADVFDRVEDLVETVEKFSDAKLGEGS